jgi:Domain of unknown function (DUF4157)
MSEATRTTHPRRVIASPATKSCACGTPGQTGECADCRDRFLQRAAAGGPAPASVPASVRHTISSAGRPLDSGARAPMEARFGRDFGAVRVHTDPQAAESARAVSARAYTVGQHIAFDRGQYQPHTPAGQRLLAHELAHTVQQRGLHRKATESGILDPGADSRYEREAERAANAAAGRPSILAHSAVPVICRAANETPPSPAADETEPVRVWEPVPASSELSSKGVAAQSQLRPGQVSPKIRAYKLRDPFVVPAEKGPVVDYWRTRAKAGGLESFIDAGAEPRAALKQERPGTDQLQRLWMTRVGLATPADAAKAWTAAGGDKSTSFEPKVGGQTCQMDHIIELQIGGNNVPENIQCLDAAENQKSGRDIFADLREKAKQIRSVDRAVQTVVLHFDDVTQASAIKSSCYKVEQQVIAASGAKPTDSIDDSEPYEIVAAVPATLAIDKGVRAPRKALTLPIEESKYRQTRAAATLIPGLILHQLHLQSKGNDEISAGIDTGGKTRLPVTLQESKGKAILLSVDQSTHVLRLKSPRVNLAFTYPYLSEGAITSLSYDPQTGVSGEGWLRPSLPFLNRMRLTVRFGPDRFEVVSGLDPKHLTMPFGARVAKAEIGLLLYPEFKPSGQVEFVIAPGGRKIIDGQMKFDADANGLVATGTINGHLPGVDKAEGVIEYRAQQWSGKITVESSQIKIPSLKAADLVVTIDNTGPTASGHVLLGLPGGNEVDLRVSRERGGGFIYAGKGEFNVPGLHPVQLAFIYAGHSLTAEGHTKIAIRGFTGSLDVCYHNGTVSGEGTISGKKGRADLKQAKVKYNGRTGKFSGEGLLSYQVSESLIASAGVEIPEVGPIKVKGALTFPKPIELFKAFGDQITVFTLPEIKIPIPGASIGPVGLVVTIDGGITADYRIGPGQLQDTKIAADFQPFEESKDLKVDLQSQLAIPAHAGISGRVRAALAIDAVIASVSGGITVIASANLDGGLFIAFVAHYEKDRFTAEATPEINATLVLGLNLDADLTAKAGIGWFSVETTKVWHLKQFRYNTGLTFGMKAPISYDSASNPPFTPPSVDKIQWIRPQIDASDMLSSLMAGSGAESTS